MGFLRHITPVAWGFIGVQVVLVSFWAAKYMVPLIWISRQAKQVRSRVKTSGDHVPPRDLAVGQPLRSVWIDYARATGDSLCRLLEEEHPTVSAHEYFTLRKASRSANGLFAQIIPGVFAGFGILGTFVGIVIGIYEIRIDNAGQLMASVRDLLGGMSTAFVSSIVGIGFSICWLTLYRWLAASADRRLFTLATSLDEKYQPWEQSKLLRASLHLENADALRSQQLLELQKETKGILQNLGTDIAEAMEKALEATLGPKLEELSGSMTALASDTRNEQTKALEEMAGQFREQLMGSVKADFDALAESMRTAAEIQQKTSGEFAEFFGKLGEVTARQSELLESTLLAADQFKESTEGLAKIHAAIRESIPAIAGASEQLAGLVAEMSSQSEVFASANEKLREQLATHIDSMGGQVDRLADFWERFSGSLEGFREKLESTLLEFRSMAAESLTSVFKQFDTEMARVVKHLSGTLAEVRERSEELAENVKLLRDTMLDLDKPVESFATALRDGSNDTKKYGEILSRLETYLGESEPLLKALFKVDQSVTSVAGVIGELNTRLAANGSSKELHGSSREANT